MEIPAAAGPAFQAPPPNPFKGTHGMTRHRQLFLMAGTLAGLALFAALLTVRLERQADPSDLEAQAAAPGAPLADRETFMAVFQQNRRIGTSHSRLQRREGGYLLHETARLRLNAMGLLQELTLRSESRLNADLSLEEGTFAIASGLFRFAAQVTARDGRLRVVTTSAGAKSQREMPLAEPIYTPGGVLAALGAARPQPGQRLRFPVFDPSSLARDEVRVQVHDPDTIHIDGRALPALRVTLSFKGAEQTAWLDDSGQVLREEGLLGIRQERTTARDAASPLAEAGGRDLLEAAAIVPEGPMPSPEGLSRLRVRLTGAALDGLALAGGRQSFDQGVLTIIREDLPAAGQDSAPPEAELAPFLAAEDFIQADHPTIRARVEALSPPGATPLERLRAIVDWIRTNIQRRPVIAVPDALATLQAGIGDCNEHAVLLAAMARAADLPTAIEAGLVYQDGRFFYHAWNRVFVGRWVTADAVLGQIPADVTHIRLVEGGPAAQLDLLGLIGRLSIAVVDFHPSPPAPQASRGVTSSPATTTPAPGVTVQHAAD